MESTFVVLSKLKYKVYYNNIKTSIRGYSEYSYKINNNCNIDNLVIKKRLQSNIILIIFYWFFYIYLCLFIKNIYVKFQVKKSNINNINYVYYISSDKIKYC